jgi:hypothetical protein
LDQGGAATVATIVTITPSIGDAAVGRPRITRRPPGAPRHRFQEDLAAAEWRFMAWCTIGKTYN